MSEHSDVRLRKALTQVPAYVPGKPAAPREGVTAYKVSSNENPYSPLPSVLKVVQDAATSLGFRRNAVSGVKSASLAGR